MAPLPSPPNPWPGTAGGAYSPAWGGNIRLYVWAGIYAGATMKWGVSATDRLSAGNVWSSGSVVPNPAPPSGRMWVDLSCDVISLDSFIGGVRSDGSIARSEAATCSIKLTDPGRIYDPSNPNGPFQYGGQTRLTPGTNLIVFAEYWNGTTVTQFRMFTGTVDTWFEEWRLEPTERIAEVQASDATKDLVNLDYGEQPAIGAGDTVDQRIQRILTYYSWPGSVSMQASTNTLQATTLAQSAWELIGRATEDELGFSYLEYSGTFRFRNRASWTTRTAPVLTIGCAPGVTSYDAMTAAGITTASLDIHNAVYASRTGGLMQVARAETSISRYGLHTYKRTDLGLQTDLQASQWAAFLVLLQGTPRPQLKSISVIPAFTPDIWSTLLSLALITSRVRIIWSPADTLPAVTEVIARLLSVAHTITRKRWEVELGLVQADVYANVMHWGAHPKDRLTVGNVYV